MNRREAILHIGTHKTGTTAFQAALRRSRESLRAAGVHVVADMESGQCLSLANEAVRETLIFPARTGNPDLLLPEARRYARRWLREQFASEHPRVIASHEALSFVRTEAEVRRIKRLMAGRRVTVIVVLRDPVAYARSFAEQLASMGFASESRYASSFMNVSPRSWLLDTDRLLAVYRRVFGRRSVIVLDYDEVRRSGSVTRTLWEVAGLPVPEDPSVLDAWENVSAAKPPHPPARRWAHREWE